MEPKEPFQNPIDPDKITENPGSLPYAHSVGGAVVKPNEESVIKSGALSAMEEQTEMQLQQIREQIELLARQANEIKERKVLSGLIYEAKMSFNPLIGKSYFLYEKDDGTHVLSMVSPDEWGKSIPYAAFIAKVKLLADHTWMKES